MYCTGCIGDMNCPKCEHNCRSQCRIVEVLSASTRNIISHPKCACCRWSSAPPGTRAMSATHRLYFSPNPRILTGSCPGGHTTPNSSHDCTPAPFRLAGYVMRGILFHFAPYWRITTVQGLLIPGATPPKAGGGCDFRHTSLIRSQSRDDA